MSKRSVADDPKLFAEWNWEKNDLIGIDPYHISYGSAKKVWWKCNEGHEWEATPNTRSGGRSCPICSEARRLLSRTKNMLAKRGSLSDNNPALAKEWHPTKNGDLLPTDVTAKSAKKVYWQCEKGHEWLAAINSRNAGAGCPVCSGHKIVIGINDLATVRPDLAAEWHPTRNGACTPETVTEHSESRVWWKCRYGHEWQSKVTNRSNGTGCPICSNRKVQLGHNDLATTDPKLAAEWHPTKNGSITPYQITAGSNKKIWWQCAKGHEWETAVAHRKSGHNCPYCQAEYKTSFPEQAIFFYFNKLTTAKSRYRFDSRVEIDVFLPEIGAGIEYDGIYYHSGQDAARREKEKQEFLERNDILLIRVKETKSEKHNAQSGNTVFVKSGPNDFQLNQAIRDLFACVNHLCATNFQADVNIARDRSAILNQFISNEKANSISEAMPSLAAEWHPTKNGRLLPEHFSLHSNKKAWWLCKNGHEWQAVINSRSKGIGCPYCSGKKAISEENDLATLMPTLANEWHPTKNGNLSPSDVTVASNKKVWWLCKKGHEWQTSIFDRTGGSGCPICSGHKVLSGENDLQTLNPALASQWHPSKNGALRACDVVCGSDKKVWWICEKGHEWEACISSRSAGYGCPYCAKQRTLVNENDLATLNPELAAEWHPTKNGDLKPSHVMPGSNKKVWWLGKCGHEWEAVISSRSIGRGCPYCASRKVLRGFNDLATVNPELAAEWHPEKNGDLTPEKVLPNSNIRVWWICKQGHEWENSINTRNSGHKCPYCTNQMVLPGFNDLQTKNPELAAEWHPEKNGALSPQNVTAGANKKAWWLCAKGHEWEASIASRNAGHGCPICAIARRSEARRKRS